MLNLFFMILMVCVCWKIFCFAVRAAWGVTKIVVTLVLFPLMLIGLVIGGLMYIALPILVLVGIGVAIGNAIA